MASKFMSHHITEFNSMLSRIASVSYFKNETFWFWITCGSLFVGCVLYVDDIALLSCSWIGLQKLVNICFDYELQWDIKFNSKKSQLATFGGASPPAAIKLGNTPMDWVERVNILGAISGVVLVKWILLTQWESSIAHLIID